MTSTRVGTTYVGVVVMDGHGAGTGKIGKGGTFEPIAWFGGRPQGGDHCGG